MYGKSFTLQGFYESKANIHLNSVTSKNTGLQLVNFKNTKN